MRRQEQMEQEKRLWQKQQMQYAEQEAKERKRRQLE